MEYFRIFWAIWDILGYFEPFGIFWEILGYFELFLDIFGFPPKYTEFSLSKDSLKRIMETYFEFLFLRINKARNSHTVHPITHFSSFLRNQAFSRIFAHLYVYFVNIYSHSCNHKNLKGPHPVLHL